MKKITDLPALTTADGNDILVIVDVSANTTVRITKAEFLNDAIDTINLKNGSVTPSKLAPVYVGANASSSTGSIASTTFASTNLQITLPSAGTWVITADVRTSITAANNWLEYRLFNTTTNVDADTVTGESDWISGLTNASAQHPSSKTIVCVTTTANNIIQLQARRGANQDPTVTSDTNGRTSMLAYRIG
jgi:hypothetical protein